MDGRRRMLDEQKENFSGTTFYSPGSGALLLSPRADKKGKGT